jgi:hypothetical protein
MEFLERINLSEIAFYERWTDAKLGALLQVTIDGDPIVGMRTNLPREGPGAAYNALLIVSGAKAGRMLVGQEVEGPAIDVGAQLEIVACSAAPARPKPGTKAAQGMLLAYPGKIRSYFVWAVGSDYTDLGGVCVRSDRLDTSVGKYIPGLNWAELIILSSRVDVALRSDRGEGPLNGPSDA